MGSKIKIYMCSDMPIFFFRFLHNSCYKLSLGCNASHFLIICLSKKYVANILKLAEKICHGWQSLCHTTVSKILTILGFRPIDSFDRHTFLVLSNYGAYFMILASGFHWIPWKRTWLILGDWITT